MRIPGLEIQLDTSAVPWRETSVPGVEWLLLRDVQRAEEGPAQESAVLIRMAPGRGYPAHRHLDVEEVLVLQGGYADERGIHGAGNYVRYEAGTTHTPVAVGDPERPAGPSNPACVLYAIARGGIELID
jgi:anti-sigma factor ChrR (cupin superfamily)